MEVKGVDAESIGTDGKMTTKEAEQDVEEAFRKLQRKISSMGISGNDLASLHSYQRLVAPRKPIWPLACACFGLFLMFTSVMLLVQWPVQRKTVLDLWFSINDMDIDKENCVVELHDVFLDVVRPPVDCSMCKPVEDVDRISNITPEIFEAKYAYSGIPIVIVDGMKNWTASNTFSFEFFKSIYGEDSPALHNIEANCQFFPYKTDFGSLGEVFNMTEERAHMKDGSEPWYIGW